MKQVAQEYELVPVGSVRAHPENPNRRNVKAIGRSIEANGFYGAVIVQKSTGYILAGNHRYQAAVDSGADELPVIYVDVSDVEAVRILLADNRYAELSKRDPARVAALLEGLKTAKGKLKGTGYGAGFLNRTLTTLSKQSEDDEDDGPGPLDAFLLPSLRVNRRNGIFWVSIQAWREEARKTGVEALKTAKDAMDPVWLDAMAQDVAQVLTEVFGASKGATLSSTAPRDSAFKKGKHFATEAVERAAELTGHKYAALFAPTKANRRGHHPAREKDLPVPSAYPERVILVDDTATSGATLELHAKALQAGGSHVSAICWVYGKAKA